MSIPYFDMHCDTVSQALKLGVGLRRNSLHLDLERLGRYSPAYQVFALFADVPEGQKGAEYFDALYAKFKTELDNNSDVVRLCTSRSQAQSASGDGVVGAFLAVEGGELLNCSIEYLERAFTLGVRFVNITWNHDNALAGAAFGRHSGGLTSCGRDFVLEAQTMGVAVDLSHISDEAFWDAVKITKKPLIAGHSDSRALCDVPRNLTDDQFRALAETGGGAGINLCPYFLGGDRTVSDVIRHIEHFLEMGGEKAVFLGGDLDGVDDLPQGMQGVQDMEKLRDEMLRLGWGKELIEDIFVNNLMEIVGRIM